MPDESVRMKTQKQRRICIIVPAFNEEQSIAAVLRHIRSIDRSLAIVVINDGSRDGTSRVARSAGVSVIDLPFNLGIGGAVQTGLKYARSHGYNVAVQVDADGQHDAAFIPVLLQALAPHIDMVIGSRFMQKTDYEGTWLRRLGTRIFSWCIRLTSGYTIYDATSGFRAYGSRAIAFLADNYPIDFPEPESIVKLLRHGFVLREIPVEMKQRSGGSSSVTRLKAAYFMVSIVIAILLESIKFKKLPYGTDH